MKNETATPAEALATACQIWSSGVIIMPSVSSKPRSVTATAEVFNAVWEVLLRSCDQTVARSNAVAGQLKVPGFPTRYAEAIKGAAVIVQHTSGGSWEQQLSSGLGYITPPNQYGFDKQGNPTPAVCLRLTEVQLDHKAAIRVIEFSRRQNDGKLAKSRFRLTLRKLSTNRALSCPVAVALDTETFSHYS